jgi:hypothetical protein
MRSRWKVIAAVTVVAMVALFSACTAVVSHERESLIRTAEAGSMAARVLIEGANFWARYFIFFIIMIVSLAFFLRRILMEIDRW